MFKRTAAAIACIVLGLFIALGTPVFAQVRRPAATPAANQFSELDRQFILIASEAGLANIQMSELALRQSTNQQVKAFAQAEINEQRSIASTLNRIAPTVGVMLPTAPGPKYQAALRELSQLPRQQFDGAFLSEGGINAHLENAATFQREAAFGRYPDLVRLASTSLPIINQHFTTASSLTNYRFAQVPQRFNDTSAVPSGQPTSQREVPSPTGSTMMR